MFRKSREEPTDESISDDLLANVPEMRVPIVEEANDPVGGAREAIDRLLDAYASATGRMKALQEENARLTSELREAKAKASVLDDLRASLNKLP